MSRKDGLDLDIDALKAAAFVRKLGEEQEAMTRDEQARDPKWLVRIVDDAVFSAQGKPRHLLSQEVIDHLARIRPVGGTRKIADLPCRCAHPGHNPPSHMVYEPGVYQHSCPGCGGTQFFTVHGAML